VLCSPLHESTRGLFDEKLLRSMKKVNFSQLKFAASLR